MNLDECEPSDLTQYRSMSDFFMRKLKPGVRPIADAQLVSLSPHFSHLNLLLLTPSSKKNKVSPADGRVVNFGTVEGGRVEQVKGSTYSLSALLSGTGQSLGNPPPPPAGHAPHPQNTDHATVDEAEFANVNGIAYSLDELLGPDGDAKVEDASLSESEQQEQKEGPKRNLASDASVALEVAPSSFHWAGGHVPKKGNKLFFSVIYLAPGDYHRFHSPANWVVERRRHFAGQSGSIDPFSSSGAHFLTLPRRIVLGIPLDGRKTSRSLCSQ